MDPSNPGLIEPIANIFLERGVLGALVLGEALIIAYLFRRLMAQHDLRINELKEEAKAHEATTREMITVVATGNSVLNDVKVLLTASLTKR